ncbi:unnamed protein product [Schistocephalus solidus]|uniref:DnaJ homolog subfamily C member 2 n=1 Tax=Schistocephalus solidus TaxID=70667 RepID=A0A183SJA4_SCHSO|nr:unnamed protein product [Schistocephalus solidus]
MRRCTERSIVIYDPHPHISIFREFAGYSVGVLVEEDDEEDNTEYLKSLDPKDWRTNDHYAVLNLKKARYRASDDEVRKHYRKLVLKHHPDKRRARGEAVKDESHDYFTCITQAIEILGNPTKRNAYDSVDPFLVDETIPTVPEIKRDFFGTLTPIFIEIARWSKRQPAPFLGHKDTPLHLVHRFYDFWDTYETTKDFSFLDEEDKDKGEDRETRRYIERQNRADRARRKAEEHKRIHQLVDLAREHDPRLIAAAKVAKQAREAKKQERLQAQQRRREEEEERARAEAAAEEASRAASEERRRAEAERLRKEKDVVKAIWKKEKKLLRSLCVDRFDHFIEPSQSSNPALSPGEIRVQTLQNMDLLCTALSHLELAELNRQLEAAADPKASFEVWQQEVDSSTVLFILIQQLTVSHGSVQCSIRGDYRTWISRVRKATEAPGLRPDTKTDNDANGQSGSSSKSKWTFEMSQILIKAVNLFPAGTQKRWEVIAAYVNQHAKGVTVTGKEALRQAKELRNDEGTMKQETNLKAFDNFASNVRESEATKSVTITDKLEADSIRPWTVSEQRSLERALRQYPQVPGEPPAERWQRIADFVGTRTRKECMLRYKDLAEQIRQKRAAMAAAGVEVKK